MSASSTKRQTSFTSHTIVGTTAPVMRQQQRVAQIYRRGVSGGARMVGGVGGNVLNSAGSLDGYRVGGWGNRIAVCPTPIRPVAFDEKLLTPLHLNIDTDYQQVRMHEKEQIKDLNNRFASFINKNVCGLEQQNKMLETKWSLLQDQTAASSKIDAMFQTYIADLQRHLDTLGHEKLRLEGDLHNMKDLVEDFKKKYEEELNKRTDCENEFVLIKKDADAADMATVELEATLGILNDELLFLRRLYDMELQELQAQVKDTSVVVEMDNSRNLDMDAIVAEVKAQYEDIASRSKAEAEAWYKHKFEEMQVSVTKYGDELNSSKAEITEYSRRITRIQSEVDLVKGQIKQLEVQIREAEERGDQAVADARSRITDLEAALQRAKQDMARQVREYQGLMSIKLALDIEIATYRKLLEGEENRLAYGIQAINIYKQTSMNYNSFPLETSGTTLELHPPSLIGQSRDMDSSVTIKTQTTKIMGTSRDISASVTVKSATAEE